MIQIHTLRWRGSEAISVNGDRTDGHLPNDVTIYCRVTVDGVEIPNVVRARVLHGNEDFTQAIIRLVGEVEVVNHTRESWDALDAAP